MKFALKITTNCFPAKFAPKIPAKSADFSAILSLKILWNLTFFSATYLKPWWVRGWRHMTFLTAKYSGSAEVKILINKSAKQWWLLSKWIIIMCINLIFYIGCKRYHDGQNLLKVPVDLTRRDLSINLGGIYVANRNESCSLVGKYVYNYNGFQSKWEILTGDFFSLQRNGLSYRLKVSLYI